MEELKMSFDPNTIEHLGIRMYSTLPPVLAELIANAYDADAEHVWLNLNDEGKEKEIIIKDDGMGMSFDEINDKFLRIGRARRIVENIEITPKGRKVIGKKGLGKLSFFGIAHEIEIITKKERKINVFSMCWEDIKNTTDKEYNPKIIKKDEPYSADDHDGTKIILRKIQRESDFSADNLADSISKLFIVDLNFEIIIQRNSEKPITVDNERKYRDLEKEVEWNIPKDLKFESDYDKKEQITGQLIATKKPISPKTNMRGITLFSRNKLVNAPEYFSDSTSSHFFSYLTGGLEVDFIDDFKEDVIATGRQSLNWKHPETQKLKKYLQELIRWLEQDWRKKRSEIREKKLSEATGVNISDWFSKLPEDIRKNVEPIVQAIVKYSELPEETNRKVMEDLHKIAPEYFYYHWRHLHKKVQDASKKDYENGDYYSAFLESVKRYINTVKNKTKSNNSSELSMMGEVFGKKGKAELSATKKLSVTKTYANKFQPSTLENIEEGQKFLSMGVVSGCRNPVAHEEKRYLKETGLFSEKDCLDALSLLSHLYKRLDDSEKTESKEQR